MVVLTLYIRFKGPLLSSSKAKPLPHSSRAWVAPEALDSVPDVGSAASTSAAAASSAGTPKRRAEEGQSPATMPQRKKPRPISTSVGLRGTQIETWYAWAGQLMHQLLRSPRRWSRQDKNRASAACLARLVPEYAPNPTKVSAIRCGRSELQQTVAESEAETWVRTQGQGSVPCRALALTATQLVPRAHAYREVPSPSQLQSCSR